MAKILKSNIPYDGPKTENLIEFMRDGLRRNQDHTIITDSSSGRSWTGKKLEIGITNLANHLISECGLKKGDVCSLYSPENDRVALAILAVIAAGGVCNFLTDKSSGREIHDTAKVLGSKFIFAPASLLAKIKPDLEPLLRDGLNVVCCDDDDYDDTSSCDTLNKGCKTIGRYLCKGAADAAAAASAPDNGSSLDELAKRANINPDTDYAIIQFSSGTTGKPKPIPRTHRNLCHLVASVDHEELMHLEPGTVLTGSLPITHRPGLWALLAAINGGSNFVIWSNLSDVNDALALIERHRVTIFSSSLPFLSMLGSLGLALKDNYDLSSWAHIITSGAKIVNPELPKRLIEGFKLKSLRQCFGMTESGWVFLIEQSLAKDNYLSVGHVCPGTEAIVLKRDCDEMLAAEERGEIALRGAQIFPGYLTDKPGVLNRSDFTRDGWFRIGDQGYYERGTDLVFIEGRFKECMMFENNCLYFPNEIEATISEHPAIEGVCVVKVGQVCVDYAYDVARAYITLRPGNLLEERELIDFVHSRTPQVILGGGVRILDKFPRLQNGKVDKQALKQM